MSIQEIIGRQFEQWTVIAFSHKNKSYSKLYICRCSCGTERAISLSELIHGRAVRCKACANKQQRKHKPVEIGSKYGNWTVESFNEGNNNYAMARCKCGVLKKVLKTSLLYGLSKKCTSCRGRDGNIKHGHNCKGKTSCEYRTWCNMKNRCSNPKVKRFSSYGGRGVKVCQRWIDSFECFLKDIGPRPSSQYSLERIDNQGNYEPANVKWILTKNQHLNKRNSFEHKGQKLSLRALSQQTGKVGPFV